MPSNNQRSGKTDFLLHCFAHHAAFSCPRHFLIGLDCRTRYSSAACFAVVVARAPFFFSAVVSILTIVPVALCSFQGSFLKFIV